MGRNLNHEHANRRCARGHPTGRATAPNHRRRLAVDHWRYNRRHVENLRVSYIRKVRACLALNTVS